MSKSKLLFIGLVLFSAIFSVVILVSNKALAYSNIYPDPADNDNKDVYLVTGQDPDVQVMNKAKYKVYVPAVGGNAPTGQKITIVGAHLCNDGLGVDNYNKLLGSRNGQRLIAEGTNVTTFSVQTSSGIKGTINGKLYSSATYAADCIRQETINFDLTAADIDPDGSGYYIATIIVNYIDQFTQGVPDVLMDEVLNGFYVYTPNIDAYIGFAAESNGYNVTQVRSWNGIYQEPVTNPPVIDSNFGINSNQRVYFNAPCNLSGNVSTNIGLYDFDNNFSVPMQEIDNAQRYLTLWVKIFEYNETTKSWPDEKSNDFILSEAPLDRSSQYQNTGNFTVKPGGNYKIVFQDVYWHNVLQYSLPYNQSPGCDVSSASDIGLVMDGYEKGSKLITGRVTLNNCMGTKQVNVSAPGAPPNPPFNQQLTITCDSGSHSGSESFIHNLDPSAYNIKFPGDTVNTYTATVDGKSVTGKALLYEVPYTRFYGNDIYASGCDTTDTKNGNIVFNVRHGPDKPIEYPYPGGQPLSDPTIDLNSHGRSPGSAVEYAAFAINKNIINSGSFNNINIYNNGTAVHSRLLTKATSSDRYQCPDIVYSDVISKMPPNPSLASDVLLNNTLPVKSYYTNSGVDINVRGTIDIDDNKKVTIFSKKDIAGNGGNVIITGDAGVVGAGSYKPTNHVEASVVLIVAEGNVYIDKGVQNLGAIIVANGTIYTCSDSVAGVAQSALHSLCTNQLVVSGALIAKDIKFGRVGGTRLLAGVYEQHTVTAAANPNGHAAEQIYYPYYLYFTSPYLRTGAPNQALYNLAPLF